MWDILNINTFWGSVFSAVIAGIILLLIPHLLLRISHLLKFFKLVARKIKIIFAMHLTVRFCLQSMLLVVFASLLLLGVIFGETTYTPKNSDIFISDMLIGIIKDSFEELDFSFVNILEKTQETKDTFLKDDQLSNDSNDIYTYIPETNGPNGTMPRGTRPQDIFISDDMKNTLTYINQIFIGCNKDWVDEKLGPPYATEIHEISLNVSVSSNLDKSDITIEFLECVYLFDIVSVTIFFDTMTNSCEAYYVTLMDDIEAVDITMPKAYSFLVGDKPLGDFTFSEIDGMPSDIYGYTTNGSGRTFYGEEYYFASYGNYLDFYFAVLDYGNLNSYQSFYYYISEIRGGLIFPKKSSYDIPEWLIEARKDFYPNTFGISSWKGSKTFYLLSSYTAFDSAVLRKKG